MSLLQRKSVQGNGAGGPEAQRAADERSVGAVRSGAPDPELVERPQRRRFTSAYKLRILRESEELTRPGDIGALLRREDLYSSPSLHLEAAARRGRYRGPLALPGAPAGRPPLAAENAELRRALRAVRRSLRRPAG